MRRKVWQITRAGLFLLFVVMLAVLGPVRAEGSPQRPGPVETKSEHSEHRDGEKLRERPGFALHRRGDDRQRARSAPLPRSLQSAADAGYHAGPPRNAVREPQHAHVKHRHSPATLQVFLH